MIFGLLEKMSFSGPDPLTTSQRSSRAFLAGKNKFDKKNSYATFCGENVPEEPLRLVGKSDRNSGNSGGIPNSGPIFEPIFPIWFPIPIRK
jgi:hypothetical protein